MSVDTQAARRMSLEKRLMSRVSVTPSGCWQWTGATTKHGYGRMSWRNHVHRTHRLAAHLWLQLNLDDPDSKVCHTCDNPPCLNPGHLYIGDQASNVQDMVQRGRASQGATPWEFCNKGHEMTPENRYPYRRGCRACYNESQRRRRRERPLAVRAIEEAGK